MRPTAKRIATTPILEEEYNPSARSAYEQTRTARMESDCAENSFNICSLPRGASSSRPFFSSSSTLNGNKFVGLSVVQQIVIDVGVGLGKSLTSNYLSNCVFDTITHRGIFTKIRPLSATVTPVGIGPSKVATISSLPIT